MLRSERKMPTRPDAVPDRLADPVTGGHLDVVGHALETADREGAYDELGAVQRFFEVGRRRDLAGRRSREVATCSPIRHIAGRDDASRSCSTTVASCQAGRVGEVRQKTRSPVRAPASDDGDPGSHGRLRNDG